MFSSQLHPNLPPLHFGFGWIIVFCPGRRIRHPNGFDSDNHNSDYKP